MSLRASRGETETDRCAGGRLNFDEPQGSSSWALRRARMDRAGWTGGGSRESSPNRPTAGDRAPHFATSQPHACYVIGHFVNCPYPRPLTLILRIYTIASMVFMAKSARKLFKNEIHNLDYLRVFSLWSKGWLLRCNFVYEACLVVVHVYINRLKLIFTLTAVNLTAARFVVVLSQECG